MSSKLEYFSENINHLQVVICDLCQKYFNGRIPYEQHLQSKNHKKKQQEKILIDKMAEMRLRQSVLPKDTTNMDGGLCNYSMISDAIPTKEVSEAFHFKQPERYLSMDDKGECLNTSFSISTSYGSPIQIIPSSGDYNSEKYGKLIRGRSMQLDLLSKEQKAKVEKQRDLELFFNRYKELNMPENINAINQLDKAKILENVIASASEGISKYSYPGLANLQSKIASTPSEQRMYSKFNFYSQNSKGMSEKMSLVDLPMTNNTETSHYASKSNEQKTYPGCDVCGIKSFVTLTASFNHSLTTEHCRKFAMYSKTSEPHMFSEKYAPSLLPVSTSISSNSLINDDQTQLTMDKGKVFSPRTSVFSTSESNLKFEESAPSRGNTASLYPIGYERKMKCKQTEEQNAEVTIHETISLPDSFNIDYGTGYHASYFSSMRDTPNSFLDQSSPQMGLPKSNAPLDCTQSEAELEQPMKYLSRRHPRIAARLSNSNITPPPPPLPQKEDDYILLSDNFHF